MVAPTNLQFDKDDFASYSDEKIATFLLSLQKNSLDELMAIQVKIAEEYADATKAYEEEKTDLRWARRRYWLLIFVGVFREIWRVLVKGKESKISELKKEKSELKENYRAQDAHYHHQLSLVHTSIEHIQLYSDEVSKRLKELADLKEVIEGLDTLYHQLENSGDPKDRVEIESRLAQHIEDREILNVYINDLSRKTELLVNSLSGLVDNYASQVPKDFLSKHRESNLEKVADLRERCKAIKHPIMPKLLAFLSKQSTASLQALQEEIAKDKSLFKERAFGDILWDANALYPAIFLEKNREQVLFDYVTLQEREVAALQEVIEVTDTKLQTGTNAYSRKMLDHLVEDRDKLNADMRHLLLLHRDVLTGNHSELLERVHFLARQESNNTKISDLKRLCERYKTPMTCALDYFLTYRTERSLKALKKVMQDDPSYLESRDLVRLIEEAGTIDARITEGWQKEEELPSIIMIQQHYLHSVQDQKHALDERYDLLTDQRVALNEEYLAREQTFQQLDRYYTQICGRNIHSYLPRAELNVLKKDPARFKQYEESRAACKACLTDLNEIKKELAALNQEIQEVSKAQELCDVEPVVFTPEVLQSLIARCGQVTRLGRIHPIAAALSAFLSYPTPTMLSKLKRHMQEESEYQKNSKLLELLNEANHYFPYIQPNGHLAKSREFEFFQEYQTKKLHEESRPSSKPKFGPAE